MSKIKNIYTKHGKLYLKCLIEDSINFKYSILEIGSEIYFKQKELYVREHEAYRNKEELIYKYKLCRKNGVWQRRLYNSLLSGASLEGKVIAVDGEKVKLHLNIDENQNEGEAFGFRYAPPSVNIMYAMPKTNESVRLYFLGEGNEEPIVTGCIRKMEIHAFKLLIQQVDTFKQNMEVK